MMEAITESAAAHLPENVILYFGNPNCSLGYTEQKVMHVIDTIIGQQVPVYEVGLNSSLNDHFNIVKRPTIIFFKNGREVDRFGKYLGLSQFKRVFAYYYSDIVQKQMLELNDNIIFA